MKRMVYLSYGNHDYQPVTEQIDSLPNNVHVFGNQVETKTLTLADDHPRFYGVPADYPDKQPVVPHSRLGACEYVLTPNNHTFSVAVQVV